MQKGNDDYKHETQTKRSRMKLPDDRTHDHISEKKTNKKEVFNAGAKEKRRQTAVENDYRPEVKICVGVKERTRNKKRSGKEGNLQDMELRWAQNEGVGREKEKEGESSVPESMELLTERETSPSLLPCLHSYKFPAI